MIRNSRADSGVIRHQRQPKDQAQTVWAAMPSRVGLGKHGHKTEAKPSTPNESGKGSTPSKEPFLVVILLLFS
jgi:hypothetical protein